MSLDRNPNNLREKIDNLGDTLFLMHKVSPNLQRYLEDIQSTTNLWPFIDLHQPHHCNHFSTSVFNRIQHPISIYPTSCILFVIVTHELNFCFDS